VAPAAHPPNASGITAITINGVLPRRKKYPNQHGVHEQQSDNQAGAHVAQRFTAGRPNAPRSLYRTLLLTLPASAAHRQAWQAPPRGGRVARYRPLPSTASRPSACRKASKPLPGVETRPPDLRGTKKAPIFQADGQSFSAAQLLAFGTRQLYTHFISGSDCCLVDSVCQAANS